MLIGDRVVCNSCLRVIGQLFNVAPYQSDFLADLTQPPYYTVCPDCSLASETEPKPVAAISSDT
ncbi:conserved protein of unknown function [Pseudomonas marincola]|uniref:Uncharacterized protein n=1 Tax=Pseudomonas marincola TaxID=437900 RepID=A0A653E363_9PSED|nr:conserved protein of unknown function [Pseudomonas marincola]